MISSSKAFSLKGNGDPKEVNTCTVGPCVPETDQDLKFDRVPSSEWKVL